MVRGLLEHKLVYKRSEVQFVAQPYRDPHPFPLSRERARGNFVVQVAVAHLHRSVVNCRDDAVLPFGLQLVAHSNGDIVRRIGTNADAP